jgi:hypothetical protein
MTRTQDPNEGAPVGREPSSRVVLVRERTPVLALMDAGNELAAALDSGAVSEQSIEPLPQAWERALFAVARDFDGQPEEARP